MRKTVPIQSPGPSIRYTGCASLFFFFQAEDGIRDGRVTGVQTCALPILLKAAQSATTEPGPDADKRIHQRHFVQGMEEVIAGTSVMGQSLFENGGAPEAIAGPIEQLSESHEALRGELALVAERLDGLERRQRGGLQKLEERQVALKASGESLEAAAARVEGRLRLLS